MDRGLNRHLLGRLAVEGVRLAEGDDGQGGGTGGDDGAQGSDSGAQGGDGGDAGGGSGDGPGDTGSGAHSGSQGSQGGQSGAGQGQGDGTDLSQLSSEQLARMVRDLRRESAGHRTAKHDAATSAKQELAQEVGKLLGLVEDDTADPDKLKDQLGTAQQKHRETAVELAVHRAAGKHDADPDRLLDSRRFLNAVHGLDPASDTFADDVGKAIGQAVEQDNQLKAAQAAPRSGGEFTGGSGGGRKRNPNLAAAVRGSLNEKG